MFIPVGIHENLVLDSKSKINDHGTLELNIKSVQSDEAVFAALANDDIVQSLESSLRFYPPNLLDFDKNKKTAADIAKDMSVLRHQFTQFARLYATEDEVKAAIGGLQMLADLGIPAEDMPKAFQSLVNEEFLHRVVTNLSKKFLDFLTSKNAFDGSTPFRMKFWRQSAAKNFVTIPVSTFDTWIESMAIPKDQSKVAYSDYEIEKGKNNAAPAKSSSAQSGTAETAKAASLFGDTSETKTADSEAKPPLFS